MASDCGTWADFMVDPNATMEGSKHYRSADYFITRPIALTKIGQQGDERLGKSGRR